MSIKVKRGLAINLPTLEEGELGFTTDSYEMYVGSDNGNILLNNGEILIRRNNGMLQYAQSSRKNQWFDICPLEEIRGDQGVQGIQGIQGVKGDKGDKGERGIQGEKGNPFTYADFTPDQLRALKGEKGDTGAKGERGLTGDKGDRGVGLNYAWSGTRLGVKRDTDAQYTYVDLRGADGKDGKQGERGERGIQGEKGETPSIAHLEQQISDKSKELDTKFNTLTAKQQQDAEVVTARDGEVSLHARLERDLEKGKIHFIDVEGSNISTESEEGYLKNVEIHGNTWQDSENLEDIRSVGTKVEGQELYEIPVLSCGKNLFDGNLLTISDNEIRYEVNAQGIKQGLHTLSRNSTKIIYLKQYDISNNLISDVQINSSKYVIDIKPNVTKIAINMYASREWTYELALAENFQLEEGTQATAYEPYKENKLTILSPVPLEKVGDVADRIICKDGVWGVEKWVKTIIADGVNVKCTWVAVGNTSNVGEIIVEDFVFKGWTGKGQRNALCDKLPNGLDNASSSWVDSNHIICNTKGFWLNCSTDINTADKFNSYLKQNPHLIKYESKEPQFTPLPHDQQIKLRTFANRTHISFDAEIQPTLKAQVPKSLGATVNTHTTQIDNLNKELDRVKKLEESTVSTVTSDKAFTTIAETTQGYFEDVKIEGKTLVNLVSNSKLTSGVAFLNNYLVVNLDTEKEYTYIVPKLNDTTYCVLDGTTDKSIVDYFDSTNNQAVKFKPISPSVRLYARNTKAESLDTINLKRILLEGDHTDKDITFFEGLKSVGQDSDEISVLSVNENLFVLDNLKPKESAREVIKVENGIIYIRGAWGESCTNPMFLKPNTTYFFNTKIRVDKLPTVADSTIEKYTFKMLLHDNKNSKYLSVPGANNLYEGAKVGDILEYKSSFTTPTDIESYTRLLLYGIKSGDASASNCGHISILDISVSESEDYVLSKQDKKQILYYNPTTQTWEKPVLREWDSIEKHSDGKYYYHKRSGEVVLNGSENWGISGINFNDSKCFWCNFSLKLGSTVVSDKFVSLLPMQTEAGSTVGEGISTHHSSSNIRVLIKLSKLSTPDVQGFKQWLQANPTTVVYQLAQEEVYECTNLDLITYSNETNLIVNSGVIQPRITLKVLSNVSNVVKLLQEKVSILENKFIKGLQQVLAGDMMSLAHLLYPEDFTLENDTPQVIPYIEEGDINE